VPRVLRAVNVSSASAQTPFGILVKWLVEPPASGKGKPTSLLLWALNTTPDGVQVAFLWDELRGGQWAEAGKDVVTGATVPLGKGGVTMPMEGTLFLRMSLPA
jgi:hypothetical protein